MRKLLLTNLIIAFFVSLSTLTNAAELRFNRNFSSNMVLQREKPIVIRGIADKGANVTVSFAGQRKESKADDQGVWSVTLDPIPANKNGSDLTATSDGNTVKLSEVLVGDVFLFAMQTSIDLSLGSDGNGKKATTDLPSVRVMMIKTLPSETPQQDLVKEATSGWSILDKATELKMNATAFYVSKDLAEQTDVPIGIIDLNLGYHFPIAWLSKDALLETEEIFGKKNGGRVPAIMKMMAKNISTFANEEERKKKNAKRGYSMVHPREDARFPAAGYNAVLHPMRGLPLKGILLQLGNDYPYVINERLLKEGKGTSRPHLSQAYEDTYDIRKWCIYLEPITTPRIPREWRRTFGDMSIPVGWITPPGSDLVTMGRHHYEVREMQRQTADQEKGVDLILSPTKHIPFSAQPAEGKLVVDRCKAWLMGAVYKKDGVVPTGPVFDKVDMDYSKAQVFFKTGTGKDLKAAPGSLDNFEVAGVDFKYYPAKAEIDGETIRLKSDKVSRIAYVRYNWKEKPDQGITNGAGLPAVPFNTDGHEYPKKINTLGEEVLPPEFFTPVSQWKNEGAIIFNGKLNTKIEMGNGKYLGPTGLRVNTFGPNLYVIFAYKGSPSDGKIFPGDILYGVNGKLFGEDMFGDVAEAITEAETEEKKGGMSFDLVRDGKKMTVDLQLEVLGAFSPTAPYDCPKTDKIVANAEAFLAKYGGVVPGHPVFSDADAMFLLGAGSPEYQGLVRRHVYNRISKTDLNQEIDPNAKDPKPQGGPWDLSADILMMSEYYLATGDAAVLPYLRYKCDTLTSVQIKAPEEKGPWPKVQKGQTGGWRHNYYGGATYGTMPAIGVPAALGYHLTKESGVKYDFKGYERAVNWFLHNGAKVGQIGYGYHAEPVTTGNNIDPELLAAGKLNPGNGGVAGAAILFDLIGNGPVARTCSLVSTHSYNNTSYAHGGHFWVNFYTPLGAKVHGKKPFQFFMKGNRNYQELHRMHDHSRQEDRVFGVGQYLAYVLPRERLRILGAHESVFAPNPPEVLEKALQAYHKRDYAACEKMAASLVEKGELHGLSLQKTEQLRDAAALIQKSIDHDLEKVETLIEEGKPYEASLDLTQLKAVVLEGSAEFAAIDKKLSDPALKKAIADDRNRYNAYLKTLPLQLPEIKKDDGPEWKILVNKETLKGKHAGPKPTVWRMKVLESLSLAPEGWTENEFDDTEWQETTLPVSWYTNHTAVLRAPFEIKNLGAVKSLRLRQWAFRQEDMQVFLNGKLIAKISASGSGGKEITIPLKEYAVSLLQEGRNTLSATYKNTWRWGRYFRGAKSVYNDGVHLILEMQEK